ncbi:MAG: HAD family phosphatase [Eudoraea sp.]|nr:HAD family phosphatase [Eudoraea sp.]
MIKNIIFDFGDVFINLDKSATMQALVKAGYKEIPEGLFPLVFSYEKGIIDTQSFIDAVRGFLPNSTEEEIMEAWNAIILDFPEKRLQFLQKLANTQNYRLFLLSNTNELHIQKVISQLGERKYEAFKAFFEGFYLSHRIGMRKPDPEIFKMFLTEHGLKAKETLFVDDTLEHILSAKSLGFQTWHLMVGKEDVTELNSHT